LRPADVPVLGHAHVVLRLPRADAGVLGQPRQPPPVPDGALGLEQQLAAADRVLERAAGAGLRRLVRGPNARGEIGLRSGRGGTVDTDTLP
jgi:hypothetical protein